MMRRLFHVDVRQSPFVVLLTVPAGIALLIGLSPFVFVPIERFIFPAGVGGTFLTVDANGARSVLSTIASAAMTALSLTYSLVLVVFTLAAGTIGPRLLKRFTTEWVNQVTAGLLGGTFLYALMLLFLLTPDQVPTLSIMGAIVLSALSVLQLIYFVRHVSKSISIDEEIAEISQRVTEQLVEMHERGERRDDTPKSGAFEHPIKAEKAGYVGWIDEGDLLNLAKEHDLAVWLDVPSGAFVLAGETLARVRGPASEEVCAQIGQEIVIEMSRAEHRTAEFSINLLVEIALRALSPGINDTFTALAVANGLCNAFAAICMEGFAPLVVRDEAGEARLVMAAMTMTHLVGQAFHPLRQACHDNVQMAEGLARTYARLYSVGADEMREVMAYHAHLLLRDLSTAGHLQHDMDRVRNALPYDLREVPKK